MPIPAPNDSPEKDKIEFKDFLKLSKWVFTTFFKAFPFITSMYVVTSFILQMRDLINAYIFAKIIDALIATAQSPNPNLESLLPYVALSFGYNITDAIVSRISSQYSTSLDILSGPVIQSMYNRRLKELGIQTLEQPEINNKMFRAGNTLGSLINYMDHIIRILSQGFRMLTSLTLIISISPILLVLITVFYLPSYFVDKSNRRFIWQYRRDATEKLRLANMSANDISSSRSLLEIIINGSFNFFDKKYRSVIDKHGKYIMSIYKKWRIQALVAEIPNEAAMALGLIEILKKLLASQITIGTVTFQFRILGTFQGSLSSVTNGINNLYESSLRLKDTYALFIAKPAFEDGPVEMPKLAKGPEILIKHMDFTYPNSEQPVFTNMNLHIKSGEKVAIVGHNGAGKTTLVKLLCKVYKANEGELLINGRNILEYKADSYYQNLGVLLQDYNGHPQLTVKENIYVGNTSRELNEVNIRLAAQSADATEFIENYKAKYDQILSERIKGGTRPSSGQWQKIAIARFFYRDAPLVIFDEPTASIDAVSEFNIFNSIYSFFVDKTVIIISHRFSTVRNADRIIVMDHGQIVEEGTHTELLALKGTYAKAFMLQAKGYKTDE